MEQLDLKENYALKHSEVSPKSIYFNKRLYITYENIIDQLFNKKLEGVNIDLGSGDKGFTKYCKSIGIESFAYDYPEFDIEKDKLISHADKSIDFVTMNAVIEHIKDSTNILLEIKRVLKEDGFLFIRTPNWQLDFKNFYNDPTHIKPYTPHSLKYTLTLFGMEVVFLEPGLICKSYFWWRLPDIIKWNVASKIIGGTKSIIAVSQNKN